MNVNVFEKGDFLYDTEHNWPVEIKSAGNNLLIFDVKPVVGGENYSQCEPNLSPIELDESFLLENGFYESWRTENPLNMSLDYKGFYHAGMEFSLVYSQEKGFGVEISRNVVRFKYVHELQHLMRFANGFDMEFTINHTL